MCRYTCILCLWSQNETSGPAAAWTVCLHLLGLLIMKYIVNNNQLMYFYLPESCDFVIYNKSLIIIWKNILKVSTNAFCSVEKLAFSTESEKGKLCQNNAFAVARSSCACFNYSSSGCTAPRVIFSSFVICPKLKQEFSDGRNHMNEYLTGILEYLQGC